MIFLKKVEKSLILVNKNFKIVAFREPFLPLFWFQIFQAGAV